MKVIKDIDLLEKYVHKLEINTIFTNNMTQWMELHFYKRYEEIYTIEHPLDYFYFLVKGKLKIHTSLENGKTVLLRFYKPLSILGDLELLADDTVVTNVTSVTEALLIGIPRDKINQYALDDPTFLRFIIKNLSHKLYTLSNMMALNLTYPLETKLASYLISITSDENEVRQIEELKTTNTHEIATLLGTSYRHLNRILQDFVKKGLIERKDKKIIVKDYEQLKKLSAELYK